MEKSIQERISKLNKNTPSFFNELSTAVKAPDFEFRDGAYSDTALVKIYGIIFGAIPSSLIRTVSEAGVALILDDPDTQLLYTDKRDNSNSPNYGSNNMAEAALLDSEDIAREDVFEADSITWVAYNMKYHVLMRLSTPMTVKLVELKNGTKLKENSKVYASAVFYQETQPWSVEFVNKIDQQSINLVSMKFDTHNRITVLCQSSHGFYTRTVKIAPMKQVDLNLNYGDSFLEVHKKVNDFIYDDNSVGLAMLHGTPGTGKTSYLRYLLRQIEKKVIYIPPDMVTHIADPTFITFLMEHGNSVLIVEDAEDIILSREDSGSKSGAVANLLNMTDGILGDILRMKVICTFNTAMTKIDAALMRKGRLAVEYEFNKLSVADSNRLLTHLGFEPQNEEMTLGEIYNFKKDNLHKEIQTAPIGFKV